MNIYTPKEILQYDVYEEDKNNPTFWKPSRPITYWSFKRFKLAWYVFICRYDVLDWEE